MSLARLSTPLAVLLAAASPLSGQTDVTFELGMSQIGPPMGSDAESARFGVGGLRASHYSVTGSGFSGSVLVGRTIGGENGGDFVSASLGSSMMEDWGGGWTAGMDLRLFGFGVRAPFPYRAIAAEGGPMLQYRRGSLSVKAAAVAGVGRSRFEIWRVQSGATSVLMDDLWRVGGLAEVMLGSGPVRFGVAGGAHETPGGVFGSGGGRVAFAGGWGVVELSTDVWSTPLGSEVTGGLAFVMAVSDWSLRGFVGRSQPDPLTLAQPGSGSGGLLVGRSLYAALPTESTRIGHEILTPSDRGAWVRMSVEAPASAQRVEVLGDFTLWVPVPMRRLGDRWQAEVEVDAGSHHYGYLVDGEWYVPDDESSAVPDEWGRMTAILVIEGGE